MNLFMQLNMYIHDHVSIHLFFHFSMQGSLLFIFNLYFLIVHDIHGEVVCIILYYTCSIYTQIQFHVVLDSCKNSY